MCTYIVQCIIIRTYKLLHVGGLLSMEYSEIKESDFVKSLEKGLLVITAFSNEHTKLSISGTAKLTGLSRPAARRILLTLSHLGYLKQSEQNTFSLTPKILSLGYAYLQSNIWSSLTPFLENLSERLHESTSVSILDGDEIVYVARVAVKKIMNVSINVGSRLPASATSMGQVMLAYSREEVVNDYLNRVKLMPFTERTLVSSESLLTRLNKISEKGYNLVDQELEIGLTSIAVPIFNSRREIFAALNVSLRSSLMNQNDLDLHETYIAPLQETALMMTNQIKYFQ